MGSGLTWRSNWLESAGPNGMEYSDQGASHYEDRYRRRVLTNLERRAKSLGYVLHEARPPRRRECFLRRPR